MLNIYLYKILGEPVKPVSRLLKNNNILKIAFKYIDYTMFFLSII